jgi:hypothetical protein
MDRLKTELAWKELHSASRMPAIRANTQSFVFKEHLYLFLGSGAGISRTNEVWRYNLMTNMWSIYPCKGDTPVERDGHTVTYIGNGKFVVYGGQGKPYENEKSEKLIDRVSIKTWYIRELYNSMYILDANEPAIGVWTRCSEDGVAPMPRRGHTMTYYASSLLNYYNKSGYTEEDCHNISGTMSRTTQHTSKSRKGILSKEKQPGTVLANRSLILYGGAGMEPSKYTELIFNDFWSYPADGGQWTRLQINGAVPHPLFDHRAELVDDTLVIVGGIVGSANNSTYKESDNNVTDVMLLNIHTLTLSYLDLYDARGRTTQLGLHGFSLCIDWSSATDGNKSLLIFGGREIIDSKTASLNENSETNTFGRKKKSKQKQSSIMKLDIDRGLLAPVKFKGVGPTARYGHVGIACKPVEHIHNESRSNFGSLGDTAASYGTSSTSAAIKEEPIMIVYGGSNVVQGATVGMGGYCDPVMFRLINTQINLDLLPEDEIGSRPSSAASKSSRISGGSSMQLSFGEGGVMLRDLEDDDNNQVQSKSSVWEKMHASSIQRAKTASGYSNSDASLMSTVPRNPRNWSELKLALSYPASEKHSIRSFHGGSTAIGEGAMESSFNITSNHHQTKSLPKLRESQTAPARSTMKSSVKSTTGMSLGPDNESGIVADEAPEKKVDLNSLPEHERVAYIKKQEKIKLKKLSQTLKQMGASGGGNNVLRAKEIYYKQFPPPSLQSKLPLHDQEFFCSAPTSMSRRLTSTAKLHHHGSKLDAFDF